MKNLIFIFTIFLTATSAIAQVDSYWTNHQGGAWGTKENWSVDVPNLAAKTNAFFTNPGPYKVTFSGARDGYTNLFNQPSGSVLLDLQGNTLSTQVLKVGSEATALFPTLVISGGVYVIVSTAAAPIGGNGDSSSTLICSNATFISKGALFVGNLGTGVVAMVNSTNINCAALQVPNNTAGIGTYILSNSKMVTTNEAVIADATKGGSFYATNSSFWFLTNLTVSQSGPSSFIMVNSTGVFNYLTRLANGNGRECTVFMTNSAMRSTAGDADELYIAGGGTVRGQFYSTFIDAAGLSYANGANGRAYISNFNSRIVSTNTIKTGFLNVGRIGIATNYCTNVTVLCDCFIITNASSYMPFINGEIVTKGSSFFTNNGAFSVGNGNDVCTYYSIANSTNIFGDGLVVQTNSLVSLTNQYTRTKGLIVRSGGNMKVVGGNLHVTK